MGVNEGESMDPKSIPDGGPAFPPMHDPDTHASGMTLRDYFAAKAMQVTLVELWAQSVRDGKPHGAHIGETAATFGYEVADAMLAARG